MIYSSVAIPQTIHHVSNGYTVYRTPGTKYFLGGWSSVNTAIQVHMHMNEIIVPLCNEIRFLFEYYSVNVYSNVNALKCTVCVSQKFALSKLYSVFEYSTSTMHLCIHTCIRIVNK